MALFRGAPYAPVWYGSSASAAAGGYTASGWFWVWYPGVYADTNPTTGLLEYRVSGHNYDGAAYDPDSVVVKVYTLPYEAVPYGPEKTQDPTLWSTTPMPIVLDYPTDTSNTHTALVPVPTVDDNVEMVYWVVEADGEPVLSWGGIPWTGDEYVVVDTPAYLVTPFSAAGQTMTAMLGVDFEVHVEDPDGLGLAGGDQLNPWVDWWVNWGDGNIQNVVNPHSQLGDHSFGRGGALFHTYTNPGPHTIRVYCGFAGSGFNPPTIAGDILATLLGTFTFVASMPPAPIFSQPRTTYTMSVSDMGYRDVRTVDYPYPAADELFGEDQLLGCIPFSVLRTSQVEITPTKVTPSTFTFHKPHARFSNGYRGYGNGADSIVGVGEDVVMRRDLGRLENPRPPVTDQDVPEFTEPTWQDYDLGYYTHGDGPNPSRWRMDSDAVDATVQGNTNAPYYMHDYHAKTREGVYSTFEYAPGTFYEQQRLGFYSMLTGEVTHSVASPQFPDSPSEPFDFYLPEAYVMYGDDEVLWYSNTTESLWRHNHSTGESRLIGSPFGLMFSDPNNRLRFNTTSPSGLISDSDGYSPRILNVRNDGSVTMVIRSRPTNYVPIPDDYYHLQFGGYAWWVFSIDRGGRLIGQPRRISESRYYNDSPFDLYAAYDSLQRVIVADPELPIVYVPAEGTHPSVFNENVYQTAVYAVDLVTGAIRRAVWLGHPWTEWNFDATNWEIRPPETSYSGNLHEIRHLGPGEGYAATNLPPGTWSLRPPPFVFPEPNLTAEEGSTTAHYQ